MPLNPLCITCGEPAKNYDFRPYCSPKCDPKAPVRKANKLLSEKPPEKKSHGDVD